MRRTFLFVVASAWLASSAALGMQVEPDRYELQPVYYQAGWLRISHIRKSPDLNGDGYEDLLAQYEGSHFGFYPAVGLLSGLDGLPLWYHRGEVEGGFQDGTLGQADVADVNGDGQAEIVLGWETVSVPSGVGSGKVTAKSVDGATVLWTRFGDGFNHFGAQLRCIGDADGDGGEDVLVWSWGATGPPYNEGHVSILSGRDGSSLWEYSGPGDGGWFGYYVAEGVGDVDADGRADFAIGSPRSRPDAVLWVYSGRTGQVLWEWRPGDDQKQLGSSVEGPGDLDGDGHADIVVSTTSHTIAYSGADQSVLWQTAHIDGAVGPFQMSHLEDDDGDGVPEVLVAHQWRWWDYEIVGGVLVLSGRTGRVISVTWDHDEKASKFGEYVDALGDVNGDGLQDWVAREMYYRGSHPSWIVVRKSLRFMEASPLRPTPRLQLVVPSSPGRMAAVFFALSHEVGVPLATRILPLDDDLLLRWSLAHPLWIPLDARGEARFDAKLPAAPQGPVFSLSCAAVVLDPTAPQGLRTVTNAVEIPAIR